MPHTSSAKVTLVFSWINGWFHDRCLPVNSASKGNFGLKLPSSMRSRKKDSNSAKLAWDHWYRAYPDDMHPAMHQGNSIQETQSETPSLADFVHLQLGTIGFCLMESR